MDIGLKISYSLILISVAKRILSTSLALAMREESGLCSMSWQIIWGMLTPIFRQMCLSMTQVTTINGALSLPKITKLITSRR